MKSRLSALLQPLITMVSICVSLPVLAAVFTVNVGTDQAGDNYLQDTICDTTYHPAVFDSSGALIAAEIPRSGECTLRAAIQQANATGGRDTINIQHRPRISIQSALPTITESVIIQRAGTTRMEVNGNAIPSSGLRFTAGNNIIRGFAVNSFDGNGIWLSGGGGSTITDMYVGTTLNGNGSMSNVDAGIRIDNSPNNTIGNNFNRNVISGNGDTGILINGAASSGNTITGSNIGVGANGTTRLGNGGSGISVVGASGTTIGGATAGVRNIISDNGGRGIVISGTGVTGTKIYGNYIGTAANGTQDLGNAQSGISIFGASDTHIGDLAANTGNIISGNGTGITLQGNNPAANYVQGNIIGLDVNGGALPNTGDGVFITGSSRNVIGGDQPALRNVISGNGQEGIQIQGGSAMTRILGNYIGVGLNGQDDRGNRRIGIFITGSPDTTIGGVTAGVRNIIAGNGSHGILVYQTSSQPTTIQGNYIGLKSDGIEPLGNSENGIRLQDTSGVTVGGPVATNNEPGNVIAANREYGISISGASSSNNTMQGNIIGLNRNGSQVPQAGTTVQDLAARQEVGIRIHNAPGNTVGGDTEAMRNWISGHRRMGVWISGSGAAGNKIYGNYIGTDKAGNIARGNHEMGVAIFDANGNFIGGATGTTGDPPGNLISGNNIGNRFGAVQLQGNSQNNEVKGNLIGTQADGTTPLANESDGIVIINGPTNNLVGGTGADDGNLITASVKTGVLIHADASDGNQVLGNRIYGNTLLGIDLSPVGVTPNDRTSPPDQDSGPNQHQNVPILTSDAGTTAAGTVDGILLSEPNKTYRIEFFELPSVEVDSSLHGEGKRLLGNISTTTNGKGYAEFTHTLTVTSANAVTATATEQAGKNTSEFSCMAGLLDLDADSDNSGDPANLFEPQETAGEDKIENSSGQPGRIIIVNADDSDDDKVPDFADGFNLDAYGGGTNEPEDDTSANDDQFVKIKLKTGTPLPLAADTTLRFVYSASDPLATNTAPYRPSPGTLRLWTRAGNEVRNPKPVSSGGDFVAADEYTAGQLGLHPSGSVDLYLEGIRPGTELGSEQVQVFIDPDGSGAAGIDCGDALRFSVIKLDLDVDSDRSGALPDDLLDEYRESAWEKITGAIFAVNYDWDEGRLVGGNRISDTVHFNNAGRPEQEENTIGHADDEADITPIVIRNLGHSLPPGFSLWLRAGSKEDAQSFHLFKKIQSGETSIWGGLGDRTGAAAIPETVDITAWADPAAGTFSGATPADDAIFGLEGLLFRSVGITARNQFDGYVDITLELRKSSTTPPTVVASDTVQLKVAPWIMLPHTATSEEIWVKEHSQNAPLRLTASNDPGYVGLDHTTQMTAVTGPYSVAGDQWYQDQIDSGYTHRPGGPKMNIVFRMPKGSQPTWVLRHLVSGGSTAPALDAGAFQIGRYRGAGAGGAGDFGGNMEVIPPDTTHKLGRVVVGDTRSEALWEFLNDQEVQRPVQVPTEWLYVTHVDEVFGFTGNGNETVIADPTMAYAQMTAIPPAARPLSVFFAHGLAPRIGTVSAVPTTANRLETGTDDYTGTPYKFVRIYSDAGSGAAGQVAEVTGGGPGFLLIGRVWDLPQKIIRDPTAPAAPYLRRYLNMEWWYSIPVMSRPNYHQTGAWFTNPDAGDQFVLVENTRFWFDQMLPNAHGIPAFITVEEVLADADLRTLNTVNIQSKINTIKGILDAAPGSPLNYVPVPVIYTGFLTNFDTKGESVAFTPGLSNFQRVNGNLYFPRQYGPRTTLVLPIGGVMFIDPFESAVRTRFSNARFVDDWDLYHRLDGEVHCGSEVIHAPFTLDWWENQP